MDVTGLAKELAALLSPLLPYLFKVGEKTAEEVGKKFGVEAWDQAKVLWGKLRPTVEAKPAALEAVQDAAAAPNDADVHAALRLQLKKLLAEDHTLAQDIKRWCQEVRQAGVAVMAVGDRSVAAQ